MTYHGDCRKVICEKYFLVPIRLTSGNRFAFRMSFSTRAESTGLQRRHLVYPYLFSWVPIWFYLALLNYCDFTLIRPNITVLQWRAPGTLVQS